MQIYIIFGLLAAVGLSSAVPALTRATTQICQTLPPTPQLPVPINSILSPIRGANLWHQKYNEAAGGTPTVMIHGGLGYSAHFADVIKQLIAAGRYVVAVDRRGHGRSTFAPTDVFTFDGFAQDIAAQLKQVGITAYNVVGWSDGAATTLAMLQNTGIASAIGKAIVFAGFMVPEDSNATFPNTPIYRQFVSQCATEYPILHSNVDFQDFATKVTTLESTLPQFTNSDLGKITGSKVAIVGAEYDEVVNLDVPAKLHNAIPGSTLQILTGVSHFAPLQDPTQFTKAILQFLG